MSDRSDWSRAYSDGYAAGLRAAATIAQSMIGNVPINQSHDDVLRVFVKGLSGTADNIEAAVNPSAGGIPRDGEPK